MVHSFKLSATFEHPLERLVALAREIDLVNILDERLSGQIMEQPSLFDGTFNIHVKTPWPFPRDLDLTLYACGADLSQVLCTIIHLLQCTFLSQASACKHQVACHSTWQDWFLSDHVEGP